MNEAPVHIVTDFAKIPEKPKVTIWHWVKYYAFNLYRKPLVYKRQREMQDILSKVLDDLHQRFIPALKKRDCAECKEAFAILKPQIFLSQLRIALKLLSKNYDHEHWCMFDSFLESHEEDFEKSEELSSWINGFS